jgi:multidrug efflux pump subunit AcrA (membrane-fusion protein)
MLVGLIGGGAPAEQPTSAEQPAVVGSLVIKLIDQVEVPALESGALDSLHVTIGDSLSVGGLIARIDDGESVSQRDLAATELAISRQKSTHYRSDKIARTEMQEKQAALQQQRLLARISKEKSVNEVRVSAAEKAEAVAKNEWARAEKSHARFADSVSESELESLRLKFERAQLERIQASFEHRMDKLSSDSEVEAVRVAELAVQRAEIEQAVAESDAEIFRLEVEAKETMLRIRESAVLRHQVVSPINGVVVEILKRRGEWVRPGDTVARVINVDELHAEGFLSGDVRPVRGRKVRLVSSDREAEGTIDFVSPERDSVSGEFRFLVRLRGGTFFPGDRVDIRW